MKQKSIGRNYIYNLILTALNLVFPLVTASYLSYILGAENIGKVNYATSIINWFIIFASFGIPRYGIRAIARSRDSKEELSKTFWNLIMIQGILTLSATIIYIIMILNVSSFKNEMRLHLLMVFMLVLNAFSIDWFYQGIEEYGYITIRSIIFKITSIILMFILIKNKNDYIIYGLITIIGLSLNNISNYIQTKKFIIRDVYKLDLGRYIKELKVYFITTLVIALYGSLDQLFIGSISPQDLAYYVRSRTLLGVGTSITNSVITVLIPRSAYLIEYDYEQYKKIIQQSINYIYLLGFPCVVGIFVLAKEAMFLLGGVEFIPATKSLQIISILVLCTAIGTWQVNQILIPYRREALALKIQVAAAVFSIILNIILIPRYSYIGAAITWTLTETLLVIVEGIVIKREFKDIQIQYINPSMLKYLLASLIMGGAILFIKNWIENEIVMIGVGLMVGVSIYLGGVLLLKDQIVLNVLKVIVTRLGYKKKSNIGEEVDDKKTEKDI